jgi:hypothetical protein
MMTDYSDYEGWLDQALFSAMVVLREPATDLCKREGRQKLYDALKRVEDAGRAYLEYWNDQPK